MKLKYNFRAVLQRIKDAIGKGEKPRERDINWLRHYSIEKDERFMSSSEKQEIREKEESRSETESEAYWSWRRAGL